MTDRHANTGPFSDEQLVAYLDGEMDAAAARQLEAHLADDDQLRRRLYQFDHTWQLLDQLETDAAGRDFTRTTLEMVAAADQADRQRAAAPSRRVRRAALVFAVLAAAGMAGFLAVAAVRPNPNRRLLEDLPVLENLEPYRAIDSLDFLAALHEAGLFSEPAATAAAQPGAPVPVYSPAAAGKRIEAMSPVEKDQLRRRQEQFATLDAAEQTRLRLLAGGLAAAPGAEALQTVAANYYQWLKELPPIARAELLELAPQPRVEQIESLLRRQAAERVKRLGPNDAQALRDWLSGLSDRMIEALPEPAQARIRQESDPQRRRAAVFMFLQASRSSEGARRPIDEVLDERDLAALRAKLQEPTRLELQRHPVPEQWRMVKDWIPQIARHRFAGRGPRGLLPELEERGLAEFFENELDDSELDRLLALPAGEMQRELQRLYLQRGQPGPVPGFRRPGLPGQGPRSGGHRSRDDESRPDGQRRRDSQRARPQ